MRGHGLRRAADACLSSPEFGGACDSGYKCGWGVCACRAAVDCTCHNVTLATWDEALGGLACFSPDWSTLPGAAQPGAVRAAALGLALNGQNFGPTGFVFTRYTPPPRYPPTPPPKPDPTPLARSIP